MIIITVNRRISDKFSELLSGANAIFKKNDNKFEITDDNSNDAFMIGRIYQSLVDNINHQDEKIREAKDSVSKEA